MITVQDPGYSWGVWIGFGLVLLVWTLAFVIPAIVKRGLSEDTWAAFWSVLFVLVLVGTVVSGSASGSYYQDSVEHEKVKALQEAGYDNAVIKGDEFTAKAADGSYFEGYLRPEGDLTWRIISLEEKK